MVHLEPTIVHLEPSVVHLEPPIVHLEPTIVHLEPPIVHLEPPIVHLEPPIPLIVLLSQTGGKATPQCLNAQGKGVVPPCLSASHTKLSYIYYFRTSQTELKKCCTIYLILINTLM